MVFPLEKGSGLMKDCLLVMVVTGTVMSEDLSLVEVPRKDYGYPRLDTVGGTFVDRTFAEEDSLTMHIRGGAGAVPLPQGPRPSFGPQSFRAPGGSVDPDEIRLLKNELLLELQTTSIRYRRSLDLIGFLGSYFGSIAGYYALGGENLRQIAIPAVGPLLLLEPPPQGVPHTPFPMRQFMLVGSGLIQAGFLGDYLYSFWKERKVRKRFQVGFTQTIDDVIVSFHVSF